MKFLEYTLPQIRQGADAPNAMDRIETFSLSGSAISNALREAPRLSPWGTTELIRVSGRNA